MTEILKRKLGGAILFTLWSAIFFPGVANAYVDPGSGSVIVTAILGVIGAIGYTFRRQFYRLRAKLRGSKTGGDE